MDEPGRPGAARYADTIAVPLSPLLEKVLCTMDHDARLFLLSDGAPRIGAALGAVGPLACAETPAVHAWLQAHGVPATSERVRILPADAEILIPEDAESLPVPLSEDEALRVHQESAPQSIADLEAELQDFRETTQDWEALVQRALTMRRSSTAHRPAHRPHSAASRRPDPGVEAVAVPIMELSVERESRSGGGAGPARRDGRAWRT